MRNIRYKLLTLVFLLTSSFVFGQTAPNGIKPLPQKGDPGKNTGIASGEAGRATPKHFTGISKPLPGEKRFRPGEVEKPKRPIYGTAVYPVTPSAWYPGVSRANINGPLSGEMILETPEIQSGDYIDVPTLAPKLVTPALPKTDETPEEATPAPKVERRFLADEETPSLPLEKALDDFGFPTPLEHKSPNTFSGEGILGGTVPHDTTAPVHHDEVIYGLTPCPLPEKFHPVAGDPDIPLGDAGYLPVTGPPRAMHYGLVSDSGILNAPYAPGEAAPKVWSNGRAVTMTERAQLCEGYAPIIRRRCIMAHHTNVATSLPVYCDGFEHCPQCMRPFLCGCGEETCRFCNPDSRVGPAPLCSCCGDRRPCIHGRICQGQLGHAPYREFGNTSGGIACPICKERVERIPCGCCEKCKRGETCELYKPCGVCPSCLVFEMCDLYKAERNCVLPNRTNSCNRCDNTINGEPCGSCDWCRENSGLNHEPCGHQEVGIRPKTVYNPYNEAKLFSAPTRMITDRFNNRASRFPIYYNPAPYYKETSNPATMGGYARPFTFRYTCDLCRHSPCTCTAPGNAGQVAYAYACKICDRNPCACVAEICNANMPLNPAGVKMQLEKMREEAKPKLPDQEEQAPTDGGFRPVQDAGPATEPGAWDTEAPPSLAPPKATTPPVRPAPVPIGPGTGNETAPLPIPEEPKTKEPLPFEDDPNAPKTDLDSLFEERK